MGRLSQLLTDGDVLVEHETKSQRDNTDRKRTVGDPSLRAVEHPLVPLQRGRTRRGSCVATVSGFTQGEATDVLPIEKRLLKDLLLLGGGILIDGTQVERVIDAHDLEI